MVRQQSNDHMGSVNAGEAVVVDAEDVEHRGVQVAEIDGVLGDVVEDVVGAAEFDASLMKLPKTVV
jgi:hypothetical protein